MHAARYYRYLSDFQASRRSYRQRRRKSRKTIGYVQLAVNRQPGYRQGTRRASYSVPVCFLSVLCELYDNHHFRVTRDELREDTAPRHVMHWTSPFACGKILSISNIMPSLVEIVLTATEKIANKHPSQRKNVQLVVNRQPGFRQGTRRASHCVHVCVF